MSVDEARRLLLHDAARASLGADAALTLMEMLPPSGWGDVATRQQLDAVESRLDTKIEAAEERLELRLTAAFERGQRRMLQWNVATLITVAGVVTAIVRIG